MICQLCPRQCGASRTLEEPGLCGVRTIPGSFRVAKTMAHHWEEPYISGTRGSGAIFFSGCALGCVFCQNYSISHMDGPSTDPEGVDCTIDELVDHCRRLADQGVHNFNLITAAHFVREIPSMVQALRQAGLRQPIVWNTSSYESVPSIRSLTGFVDVFLPDFKFWDSDLSLALANASNYRDVAMNAIREMLNQQPTVVLDADGLMIQGVAIRHLVLPGHHQDSMRILDWIAAQLSLDIPLALMNQYTPFPDLSDRLRATPELLRRLTTFEYQKVVEHAQKLGFTRLLGQARSSASASYTPDFDSNSQDSPDLRRRD